MSRPTLAPAAALRRIAFLLERGREPTYKVRAFRRAAAAVDATDPDELARLAAAPGAGLRGLPGVGEVTERVIREALAGEVPVYLRRLEAIEGQPVAEGAAALRAALRGDCHSHSTWSDGGSPIAEMAEAARDLGHEYLALTDHSPRLTVANGLSPERLRAQLDEVARLNEDLAGAASRGGRPFRVLTGNRGRHPRGRLPRPVRRAAGPARRGGGQRPLQAAHARPGDDPADGRRRGPTPTPTSSATAPAGWWSAAAARRASSTPTRCSAPAPSAGSRSRSTPAPNARTRPSDCCGWPWRPAAGSPSTPTPTPPAQLDWQLGRL
jgi:hypothetical protein